MKVKRFAKKQMALEKLKQLGYGWVACPLVGDPNPNAGFAAYTWVLVRVSGWCDKPDGSIKRCSPIPQFLMEDGSFGFPLDEKDEP